MSSAFNIQKIAILGAGVMGAQIAAHFANAGFPVYLYDLPSLAEKALQKLLSLTPSPLGTKETLNYIQAVDYTQHLSCLQHCDLIIEAITEQKDKKTQLYAKIAPYLHKNAILASNTSGLSITELAAVLPSTLQAQFCGVHFFNPPRYMPLVEIVPSPHTNKNCLQSLKVFLEEAIGKEVVQAKDTPNFIANRIGVFFMLSAFQRMAELNLSFDEVDLLTGTLIGHPKSAIFRTLDIVGLDTMKYVIQTFQTKLPNDPWHPYYNIPTWLNTFITQGDLGQKTGQGIYRKRLKNIEVFSLKTKAYEISNPTLSPQVQNIFETSHTLERWEKLSTANDPQAKFLWLLFLDLFHYTAYHAQHIAHNVQDIDKALRCGFAWSQGPFEKGAAIGWEWLIPQITQKITEKNSLTQAPLPDWLEKNALKIGRQENYSFDEHAQIAPVYKKYTANVLLKKTQLLFNNPGLKLQSMDNKIGILSFKTKKNTFNESIIYGLGDAIKIAEKELKALVIWQETGENFSYGADLAFFLELLKNDPEKARETVQAFQNMCLHVRNTALPIVVALRGRVLGGGCELALYADARVAIFESYIGLVETGVGLLPAGGGSTHFAIKAFQENPLDKRKILEKYFYQIVKASVSQSATEARQRGFLKESDTIIMQNEALLDQAIKKAQHLIQNYRPHLPQKIQVLGREGIALFKTQLINLLEGHRISEHDFWVASKVAEVLCGGDINANSWVDEAYLLKKEVDAFMQIALHEKTLARIEYTLKTGKPLRN